MAWVRSDQSLAAHPKTKRAARTLGLKIPHMMGHLHCLWHWALDYAPDGDLSKYDAWEIAEAAMFDGDPDAFATALVECGKDGPGFLEKTKKGLFIHDWYEYAGRLIDQREANTQRMRNKRAEHVQRTCSTRAGATNEENEENEEKKEGDARARETTSLPVEKSAKEETALRLLYSIPGFPVDEAKELDVLREPRDPRINLEAEARGYRDWVADQRDKGKKTFNFRSSWRNRLVMAEKICKERDGPLLASHVPFVPPADMTPAQRRANFAAFMKTDAGKQVKAIAASVGEAIP